MECTEEFESDLNVVECFYREGLKSIRGSRSPKKFHQNGSTLAKVDLMLEKRRNILAGSFIHQLAA